MKIALVNYRYYISGGPERYMFNIKETLESHGHKVIPFSVKHTKNRPTEYDDYFLDAIGNGTEVYAGEYNRKSLKDSYHVLTRMLYSFEAKRKFRKFLKETSPDLIYILYFQNKISCSIVDIAYSMKIPIVQRISDFSLLSPCNIFYRYDIQEICEKCLHGSKLNAVKYKCVYHSSTYSLIKALSIYIQRIVKIKDKIHTFIFPSLFTMNKFIEAGYEKDKLKFLPTFFNKSTINKDLSIEYEKFALYIGRTDPDKGMMTLLDSFINTEYSLKIIGFSSNDYQNELIDYIKDKKHNIEFLGKMEFEQMQKYLSKCLFTIIPSEWYDNLPNTLLESFAFKKCVVATNIGSLRENIIDNETGLLFDYKKSTSLSEKAEYLFKNPLLARQMGENANKYISNKFSVEYHYNELITIFEELTNGKKTI